MIIQDISFPDPQANLDFDDELLRCADREGAGEFLRFWESPKVFIVLGRTGKEEEEVELVAARKDGVPVLRRSSGGGTVVQGPGCLNFTLVLSKALRPEIQTISNSYRAILEQILKGLRSLRIEGEFRPTCDLVLKGTEKKFSGNAQRRGREHILHHGTILYDFDLRLISSYLKMPSKMPEYRQGRAHVDFVTNVSAQARDIERSIERAFIY